MRHKLRVTRTTALTLFACVILYLYASGRVPTGQLPWFRPSDGSSNHAQLTSETVSVNPVAFTSIQSLWAYWSQVFYEDRPRTSRILLSSNANAVAIWNEPPGPRKPATNHILNSESEVKSLRLSHAALVKALQPDILGDVFEGTGVVMVGGGEYFGPAIIGLHMLRKTGSTLPVEIFVADASEYEPSLCEDYLPKFGARCLVLTHFLQEGNTTKGFEVTHYQLKSLAMLFSSFAEILYLDSDSIPLVDPSTDLFTTEPYKSKGMVIWPDFWISSESPLFYTIAGLPAYPSNLPKSSSEAGQVMINKRTHLKTLLLANYYNVYGPDYFYPLLSQGVIGQGDKETFMAAAVVLGEPYYRVMTEVGAVGRIVGKEFRGSGMVQHHPHDDFVRAGTKGKENQPVVRPAFLHANLPKMNAGHLVEEGDLVGPDQKRLRLWGLKEDQEKLFGYDVEKAVWDLLVKTGCALQQVMGEWKSREGMCDKLHEHWAEVF